MSNIQQQLHYMGTAGTRRAAMGAVCCCLCPELDLCCCGSSTPAPAPLLLVIAMTLLE
jgi:hypothetical protein